MERKTTAKNCLITQAVILPVIYPAEPVVIQTVILFEIYELEAIITKAVILPVICDLTNQGLADKVC